MKNLFFVLNKFVNFFVYIWIFSEFYYIFEKTVFATKFKAITVVLLVPSPG